MKNYWRMLTVMISLNLIVCDLLNLVYFYFLIKLVLWMSCLFTFSLICHFCCFYFWVYPLRELPVKRNRNGKHWWWCCSDVFRRWYYWMWSFYIGFNTDILDEFSIDLSLSNIERIERYIYSDIVMQRYI